MSSLTTMDHAMLEAMLFSTTSGRRPGDSWARLSDLPFSRHSAGVANIGSDVYVYGGLDLADAMTSTSTLYRYNIDTAITTLMAAGPPPRTSPSLTVANGKLYAMGGSVSYSKNLGTKEVWCYTPETDSWVRKTDMPYARLGQIGLALGSKIYVGGGKSNSGATGIREMLCYDTLTDTWTIGAQIPLGVRYEHSMVEYGGKFYVHGGYIGSTLKDLQCYDSATDSWTTLTPSPQAKTRHVAGVVGDRMSVLLGDTTSGTFVYQYDFVTGGWSKMQAGLINYHQHAGAVVYKDEIYMLGGTTLNGVSLFRYTP